MTHYSATSLEQIADELERRANLLDDIADRLPSMSGRRGGLREAATLVRNTRLADPAMEAMVKALEDCVAAMALVVEGNPMGVGKNDKCSHGRFGFEGCESCTDNALDPALEAARALLAKDNGHV